VTIELNFGDCDYWIARFREHVKPEPLPHDPEQQHGFER
jgi:hypothetical protein